MKRYILPIVAILSVLAAVFLISSFFFDWANGKEEKEYKYLETLPQGKPMIRMLKAFESGAIHYQLDPLLFAWNPKNFTEDKIDLFYVPQNFSSEIALNEAAFENLGNVRRHFHESFESGEAVISLDDSLFPWKSFFYEDEEEDE